LVEVFNPRRETMNLNNRQIGLLQNAVFLWLSVLPPVSEEVQNELSELLSTLCETQSSAHSAVA
jgi:uncharacterized protein YktB (UPF0637 family)